MPQSQVEPFNQPGADLQSQSGQFRRAATNALGQRLQAALLFLLDQLRIDQFRVRFDDRIPGPPTFARAGNLPDLMRDRDERRQVAAEAITEETGHSTDDCGRPLNQLQSALEGARANIGGQQQAELRRKADPHPLASISAFLRALAIGIGFRSVLAQNEGPPLIQLHLGDLHLAQQVLIDLGGLPRRSPQPFQDGLFRHAKREADAGQLDFAQQEFEHDDDFLFRRTQVKKDRLARLGELLAAEFAVKDAPLATLGPVSRKRSDIAMVHQSIMRASQVGAWLAPVFGFSQGSVLRLVWSHNHNCSGNTGPFLFQSISG